ncbi:MAG: PilZ domain-containing protein [Novosphingobium sp.]
MEFLEGSACLASATPHLPARLRTRTGMTNPVEVTDVSLAGCMIERRALSLAQGDRVMIQLADLGLMPAEVIWVEERNAGLRFENELYEPVLEHLQRCFSGAI